MADKTLDQLTLASSLSGGDIIYLVQGGSSRKASLNDIASAMSSLGAGQNPSAPFKGALVRLDADKESQNFPQIVYWDAAEYDDGGFFDPSVATSSRLVVPSGVTKVRVYGAIRFNSVSSGIAAWAEILKNGATYVGSPRDITRYTGAASTNIAIMAGPPVPVTPGDYFEVNAGGSSATNAIQTENSYFAIEAVEYSTP